ncbi:MAG: fibronectin type III domain-containing protein [Muribaculaceae bacterium]|nr:fibronectin type III domain-containing protein [Muribaculaceae bacterium]
MKKTLILLSLSALSTAGASAQAVFGYSPETSQSLYTPLSSPTVIYNAAESEAPLDDAIENIIFTPAGTVTEQGAVTGYEIGFDFPFAGVAVNSFAVAGQGYIILGNGEFEVDPSSYGNFFSKDGIMNAAGCVPQRGARGLENTVISYQNTDEGLVIQFENFGMMTTFWGDSTPFNMQTILCKDGSVKFMFDDFSVFNDSNMMLLCAVRAGEMFTCVGGTIGDEITVRHNGSDILTVPPTIPAGLELTLTAPKKCVMPAAQPTDLKLESTSTSISAAFEGAEGADNYLVVMSADKDPEFIPENGKYYSTGDKMEECEVAYYGPDLSFVNENLSPGTTYYYKIFAVKAYGLDGPVYNTAAPLSKEIATLPGGAKATIKGSGLSNIIIDVEANEAGDEVVILYNTYCNRSAYGDTGLFETPAADVKVGDVISVPEDYTPGMQGMPEPENAGTVAYIGPATDGISIENLDPSTGYYFAVIARNKKGVCTSEIDYLSAATTIVAPYEGNSVNFPRYVMPQGWSTSEADAEARTFSFRDESFLNFRDGTVSQGTQIIQQRAQLTRGNAEGMTAWMMPQPVDVTDRHIMAKFDVAITESANRFDTHAYNDWAEGDKLEILVSPDNGENWESVLTLTPENKPEFGYDDELRVPTYTVIEADLNAYRGKTVNVKLQWTTYTLASFGANMYVDRFSVYQGSFPEVPEVTIGEVTSETAQITWKSAQTDYELAYSEKDSENETIVIVKGSNSYKIEGLSPLTEYVVKVRGVLEGEEGFSEWSDPVEFTTADWPQVDAPENLEADLEDYETIKEVTLSWTATEEMESFEVAYREASSTEWEYITSTDPTVKIGNLKWETRYVWKVRAFCSHDRVTDFSAQANFTTPQDTSGISEILLDNEIEVFSLDGLKISDKNLKPGTYIVIKNGIAKKVSVK